MRVEDIAKKDDERYQLEKEKTIEKKIQQLRNKQKSEREALELRIEMNQNKFLRERTKKTDEIMQKYKNKARGLEKEQKAERESYERQLKGDFTKTENYSKS